MNTKLIFFAVMGPLLPAAASAYFMGTFASAAAVAEVAQEGGCQLAVIQQSLGERQPLTRMELLLTSVGCRVHGGERAGWTRGRGRDGAEADHAVRQQQQALGLSRPAHQVITGGSDASR